MNNRILKSEALANYLYKVYPIKQQSVNQAANKLEDIALSIAELQDEISYKAGIKEVVDWINNNSRKTPNPLIGRINEYNVEQWQTKLKEWGIEGK
jgi:hypothetical protein